MYGFYGSYSSYLFLAAPSSLSRFYPVQKKIKNVFIFILTRQTYNVEFLLCEKILFIFAKLFDVCFSMIHVCCTMFQIIISIYTFSLDTATNFQIGPRSVTWSKASPQSISIFISSSFGLRLASEVKLGIWGQNWLLRSLASVVNIGFWGQDWLLMSKLASEVKFGIWGQNRLLRSNLASEFKIELLD